MPFTLVPKSFRRRPGRIPGFGPTLCVTVSYLTLIVLIPLLALVIKASHLTWEQFWSTVSSPRVLASFRLSIGGSLIAAMINLVFGFIVAWVLVRYRFPGKRIIDSLVDLPFAMPTAVTGIALTALYAKSGWLGGPLADVGVKAAFSRVGVVIAMVFIGLPFVVRTLQPVLEQFERETEEAAATLGAGRLRTFVSVVAPTLLPAILTGFALAFARAIGEYGSVIFISSNKQYETEIAPLLIVIRLDEFNTQGAMVIAVVMLVASFLMLGLINLLERWASRFQR